jgi:hypothetical protein
VTCGEAACEGRDVSIKAAKEKTVEPIPPIRYDLVSRRKLGATSCGTEIGLFLGGIFPLAYEEEH